MKRLLLAFLLIFYTSFAEDTNTSVEPTSLEVAPQEQPTQEVSDGPEIIELSYDTVPRRIVNGEIFSITIKSLSTDPNYQDISFSLENGVHVKLIDDKTTQTKEGNYFYDTFYFQVTGSNAVLPDVVATASDESGVSYPVQTKLHGQRLNVVTLNPRADFSNVLAEDFNLLTHKITSYDKDHNIVLFTATATRSDLSRMQISNVEKQGIESIDNSFMSPRVTYYVVIKKGIENFEFTYFNLKDQAFEKVSIPIVVDDDSVVTQSDLSPKDQKMTGLKVTIAGIFLLVMLAFIVWRKKYKLLVILILPIAYIVSVVKPSSLMCVKQGANVYLLPLNNGTVFYKTLTEEKLEIEGESGDFKKVKLGSDKIGWVKNEDACSN